MGAPLPPRPLSIGTRQIFDLGPKPALPPNLTVNARCPIYFWQMDPRPQRLYVYQQASRDDSFFTIEQQDVNSFEIRQAEEAEPTNEDFLVVACPIGFGAVNIRTQANGFIEMKANTETLKIRTGKKSRILLENMQTVCADLTTGMKSRIDLRCEAEDITTRLGRDSVITAHAHPIARLDATLGNGSSFCTTSADALTVTAQQKACITGLAYNCTHVVPQAHKGSTIFIDLIGRVSHLHPVLLGDQAIIVTTAEAVNIFDPAQMPPKKGGKIILRTDQQPLHTLSNGCRTPRSGVVQVVSPKL